MELQKKQISVEESNSDCNQKCKKKSESRSIIPVRSGHEKTKEKNRTMKKKKEKEVIYTFKLFKQSN